MKFAIKMEEQLTKNYPYKVMTERYSEIYYDILSSIPKENMTFIQEAVMMREMAVFGRSLCNMRVELKMLIQVVELEYQTSFENIRKKSRVREVVEPRQVLMWLIKNLRKDITYKAMGELFSQDHATAMHGVKTINTAIVWDQEFRENRMFPILNTLGYKAVWSHDEKEFSFYKPTEEDDYEDEVTDNQKQIR